MSIGTRLTSSEVFQLAARELTGMAHDALCRKVQEAVLRRRRSDDLLMSALQHEVHEACPITTRDAWVTSMKQRGTRKAPSALRLHVNLLSELPRGEWDAMGARSRKPVATGIRCGDVPRIPSDTWVLRIFEVVGGRLTGDLVIT